MPVDTKRRVEWTRPIAMIVLSPLLAVGFLAIGIGSALLLVVERLAGARNYEPDRRLGYDPEFASPELRRPSHFRHAA